VLAGFEPIFLISASGVARITGMSHRCPGMAFSQCMYRKRDRNRGKREKRREREMTLVSLLLIS
jgi:hypothetical protein